MTERVPTKIEQLNQYLMFIEWNTGEKKAIPFVELRFECPCASCVDEHTGQRTLKREDISSDVRPKGVQLVGRYAIQVTWNDGHSTGMYHFDRLYDICQKYGKNVG